MTQGIKVKDLQNVSSLSSTASLLALTNVTNNTVSLINPSKLASSIKSNQSNNGLSAKTDGLYVPNIGVLSDLNTGNKNSIVGAINETYEKTTNLPVVYTDGTSMFYPVPNQIYNIEISNNITFNLPYMSEASNSILYQILIQAHLTDTTYTINLGTNYYFDYTVPTFSIAGYYNIIYEYDARAQQWYCGVIQKGAVS